MKLLRACDINKPKDELRAAISNLLKAHPPVLLEEFNSFFPDAPPPKRLVNHVANCDSFADDLV